MDNNDTVRVRITLPASALGRIREAAEAVMMSEHDLMRAAMLLGLRQFDMIFIHPGRQPEVGEAMEKIAEREAKEWEAEVRT